MIISDLFHVVPLSFPVFIFVLSLLVGSFLNIVIHRLPIMMENEYKRQCCEFLELDQSEHDVPAEKLNLMVPRSCCPHCKHQITAIENIPILSYLFLRGKCRQCKHPISIRYPLVELLSALSASAVAFYFGPSLQALFAIVLSWVLIALMLIDFEQQLLPDDITLPLLWLGLGINLFSVFTDIHSSVLGAIFGYGSLWLVFIVFKLVTGKEGIGYGDFKLLSAIGAWFGWQSLLFVITFSSFIGIIASVFITCYKSRYINTQFPFGPCLTIAAWVYMLSGDKIIFTHLHGMF